MKRLKSNIALLFVGLIATASLYSCDEGGDPDPGGTTTEKYAGDWHIQAFTPEGDLEGGYVLYSTYNASSNDANFWIDDHDTYFELKSKVQATDFKNLNFSGPADSEELYTGGTVHVTNGKIMPKAATSFGGHVVDSIYFEAEFDWAPGVVYRFGGHKRTGFLEDEL
jgi:hypothetical protein